MSNVLIYRWSGIALNCSNLWNCVVVLLLWLSCRIRCWCWPMLPCFMWRECVVIEHVVVELLLIRWWSCRPMASVEATMNLYSDDIGLCLCDNDCCGCMWLVHSYICILRWPGLANSRRMLMPCLMPLLIGNWRWGLKPWVPHACAFVSVSLYLAWVLMMRSVVT